MPKKKLKRAKEVAVSTVEGAETGSALLSPLGPLGSLGGGLLGGLAGFVLADGERITPIDMIAVPAFEYGQVRSGQDPTFMIYIKEGEMIMPVVKTDFMEATEQVVPDLVTTKTKKKRKMSKWNRYVKNKKNHIRFKNGKLNLKAMAKKGGFGKKKGGKR
tara:strand:+ start:682 stop:1161 length:480 start_codon:yes stop_codon:yes gene_type:complete